MVDIVVILLKQTVLEGSFLIQVTVVAILTPKKYLLGGVSTIWSRPNGACSVKPQSNWPQLSAA